MQIFDPCICENKNCCRYDVYSINGNNFYFMTIFLRGHVHLYEYVFKFTKYV